MPISESANSIDCRFSLPFRHEIPWSYTLVSVPNRNACRRPSTTDLSGRMKLGTMGHIVAIGGGEIAEAETEPIDRHVCASTGVDRPRALFVPTASGDAAGYCDAFDEYYGTRLGCRTDHLLIHDGGVELDAIRAAIDWADLVYVGGGSVAILLDRWRELGVDELLYDAWQDGTVIAGLSAGAMCWFASGLTDAGAGGSSDTADAPYAPVECLGWIPDVAFTPHATPDRRAAFRELIADRGGAGLALEDGCAIELLDDERRVFGVSGEERAFAYEVVDGDAREEELEVGRVDGLDGIW